MNGSDANSFGYRREQKMNKKDRTQRIRELNDQFRRTGRDGQQLITPETYRLCKAWPTPIIRQALPEVPTGRRGISEEVPTRSKRHRHLAASPSVDRIRCGRSIVLLTLYQTTLVHFVRETQRTYRSVGSSHLTGAIA